MIWGFIKSLIDSLLLAVSDWLHPEAKAERERIATEMVTQDAAIEQHEATEKVLTEQAKAKDEVIEKDKAELNEILKPLPKVERTEDEEFNRLSERIK